MLISVDSLEASDQNRVEFIDDKFVLEFEMRLPMTFREPRLWNTPVERSGCVVGHSATTGKSATCFTAWPPGGERAVEAKF